MSLEGYRGRLLELLRSAGASVGDELVVSTASGDVEGTLMPRYQLSDQLHLVLKLKNGYNVGMALGRISGVRVKGKGREPSFSPPPRPRATAGLPKVLILGTGGTIASRVDYRTGGVKAALSSEELYHLVPELSGIADISTEATMNIYSENMTAEHWSALARRAGDALKEGFDGIVVTHGTDTMHYTSAALSFALDSPPVPVVLVGSQRSSDRPSSDSATNLIGAVTFAARAPVSGVFVVMHAGPGDDELAIHAGVRVRKLHTSRRDAFRSVNGAPAGTMKDGEMRLDQSLPPRRSGAAGLSVIPGFDGRASLLKVYPGFHSSLIGDLVRGGCRGIVLEGTGLGHAPSSSYADIADAAKSGVFVGMSSQCMNGSVRMTVYDTGRDLAKLGVVPLGDMLSEVALVKLMWLLGQGYDSPKVADMMTKNLRGELRERRPL